MGDFSNKKTEKIEKITKIENIEILTALSEESTAIGQAISFYFVTTKARLGGY